jgi:hypothetical protein
MLIQYLPRTCQFATLVMGHSETVPGLVALSMGFTHDSLRRAVEVFRATGHSFWVTQHS